MEHPAHYDDAVPLTNVLRQAADDLDDGGSPMMVRLLRDAADRIEELEAQIPAPAPY